MNDFNFQENFDFEETLASNDKFKIHRPTFLGRDVTTVLAVLSQKKPGKTKSRNIIKNLLGLVHDVKKATKISEIYQYKTEKS